MALCAKPLRAQVLWPDRISTDARVALGYSDRVPGEELFLFGNAMLRFDVRGAGVNAPLGFEHGLYGRATDLNTPHETYGALTWDLPGGGQVPARVPRPMTGSPSRRWSGFSHR